MPRLVFNPEDVLPRQRHTCELFLGRLQPPHNGHAAILKRMGPNPVVAIVKGQGSSADKERNPLSFAYQKKLIKEIDPQAEVIEVAFGYVPLICNEIRKQHKEVTVLYAGADRIESYKKQVQSINAKLDPEHMFRIQFKVGERVTSATVVRDAIRSDNELQFRANTPRQIWGEWNNLRQLLKEEEMVTNFESFIKSSNKYRSLLEEVSDDIEDKDDSLEEEDTDHVSDAAGAVDNVETPLDEEDAGVTSNAGLPNVSDGLETYESPLGTEVPTAKTKKDEEDA